ncbi:hypothetical protein ACJX0J_030929 [Zea mays]
MNKTELIISYNLKTDEEQDIEEQYSHIGMNHVVRAEVCMLTYRLNFANIQIIIPLLLLWILLLERSTVGWFYYLGDACYYLEDGVVRFFSFMPILLSTYIINIMGWITLFGTKGNAAGMG